MLTLNHYTLSRASSVCVCVCGSACNCRLDVAVDNDITELQYSTTKLAFITSFQTSSMKEVLKVNVYRRILTQKYKKEK